VAENLALLVGALGILLFFAVLAAGVGEDEGVVFGFPGCFAEAVVLWQLVLCIMDVAVGTRPRVKRSQSLCLDLILGQFLPRFLITVPLILIHDRDLPFLTVAVKTCIPNHVARRIYFDHVSPSFFLLPIPHVLLKGGIQFTDPPADTPEMERLIALFTVPEGCLLVNRI